MIRKAVSSDFEIIATYYREFQQNEVDLFDLGPFAHLYVYEKGSKIVGFICYSIIYDRAEIDYIFVDKEYRNEHIASEFMELVITDSIDSGCTNISLEVAEKNKAGISLYEKYGFEKKAIRKQYYKDCDGLLMVRELITNE